MISVQRLLSWSTTSQQGALSNARAAAVLASRARLERAEVEAFLSSYAEARAAGIVDGSGSAGAAAR